MAVPGSMQHLRWCVRITSHRYFDYVIGVLILINSLLVGIEVELSVKKPPQVLEWMQPVDTAFIVVYCIEIFMRLFGNGWRVCFADGWFLLDFVLVVVGVISAFVLELTELLVGNQETVYKTSARTSHVVLHVLLSISRWKVPTVHT